MMVAPSAPKAHLSVNTFPIQLHATATSKARRHMLDGLDVDVEVPQSLWARVKGW